MPNTLDYSCSLVPAAHKMTQYLPGKLLVRHVTLSSAIPFPQVCIPANSYSGQAGKSTHVCLGWLLQGTIVDMLEDVNTGIGWVLQKISNYGGDPEQVYLVGQSCGGQLCSLTTLLQVCHHASVSWPMHCSVQPASDIPSTVSTHDPTPCCCR